MFSCKRCNIEARDGVRCSQCSSQFDFPCSGITEAGWRKLGDRKSTWKCSNCKGTATSSERSPTDNESVLSEVKRLSARMEAIPAILESIKCIQLDLAELKSIRAEFTEVKSSIEFVHQSVESLDTKVLSIEREIESLQKTKDEILALQNRCEKLENANREHEQRSRLNNIEIKGVPFTNSENLYTILDKIGKIINCNIPKEQINYIARVPMRNDSVNKNIICSVNNLYLKNDFVAAAKTCKMITPNDLGLKGESRIFINDHLTLENKTLLNKTKMLAKERSYAFVWVKGCRIFLRKNPTSPVQNIKTEQDLKKIFH